MPTAKKNLLQIPLNEKILSHLTKLNLGYSKSRFPVSQHHSALINDERIRTVPSPFSTSPKDVTKLSEIKSWSELPIRSHPEIAIIGRSNVGKSSLLNALLGFQGHIQKANVSSKPGETKFLNFYLLNQYKDQQSSLFVVDMPGYGFAYMSEEESKQCAELVSR